MYAAVLVIRWYFLFHKILLPAVVGGSKHVYWQMQIPVIYYSYCLSRVYFKMLEFEYPWSADRVNKLTDMENAFLWNGGARMYVLDCTSLHVVVWVCRTKTEEGRGGALRVLAMELYLTRHVIQQQQ